MTDLLVEIQENYPQMTVTQQRVADFVLRHAGMAATLSARQIAAQEGVNPYALEDFAAGLGFPDFTALQQALRESCGQADPGLVTYFEAVAENLRRTQKWMQGGAAQDAAAMLHGARRIYLLGMRSSFALAYAAFTRLSRIRGGVRLVGAAAMEYAEELAEVQAGDVVLAYLFPMYSKITANLIVLARARGAKVILVTDEQHAPLDGYADLLLPCYVGGVGEKLSLTAPLCLSEYLAAALANLTPEESCATDQSVQRLLEDSFELSSVREDR